LIDCETDSGTGDLFPNVLVVGKYVVMGN